LEKGPLAGFPVTRVRMVVDDGASHPVDSNEIAFRTASIGGFREGKRIYYI
jgi:elongation factor G